VKPGFPSAPRGTIRGPTPIVTQHRLDGLLTAYWKEAARRRRRYLILLAVFSALVYLAGRFGEVEPATLADHLSALTSYFSRIAPPLSIGNFAGDVAEWYWNLLGWLKLLFDTIVIAYLATLVATLGGGCWLLPRQPIWHLTAWCAGASSACLSSAAPFPTSSSR
jgi:hypothetical protein